MPLYQTKTIANILEPVAQQVNIFVEVNNFLIDQCLDLGQQADHSP